MPGVLLRARASATAVMTPIRSFVRLGAFELEGVVAMSETFEAALDDAGPSDAMREMLAQRIIYAAMLGKRDPGSRAA
jgi:hypothetical protein